VLATGLEPARMAALRSTGAALGLAALALLGMTGAAMIHWLYFSAIDRLPVGIALLLEFTGPVLVALYAHVVPRHAIQRQLWLALGLALGGLALVTRVWTDIGLDPQVWRRASGRLPAWRPSTWWVRRPWIDTIR